MNFGNISNCAKCGNAKLHLLIGGVVGAGIGAIVSYFATKKYVLDNYFIPEASISEEMLDDIEPLDFSDRESSKVTTIEELSNYLGEVSEINPIKENEFMKSKIKAEKIIETEGYTSNTEGKTSTFEIISEADYYTSYRDYDKLNMTYYAEDNIVAGESDDIVDDWMDIMGSRALDHFGEKSDDPDMVFIRNNEKEIDIELVRVHDRYDSEEELYE